MRKSILLLPLILSLSAICFGQVPKSQQVIEGMKAVVEIVTIVKGGRQKENCAGLSDICFENMLGRPVKIILTHREGQGNPFTLHIPPDKTMCKIEIPSGVYEYKVVLPDTGDIMSSGDLKLSECKKEKARIEN